MSMNEEQLKIFLIENEKATGKAVEKYVNGYLREMKTNLEEHIVKHDEFMDEVKPILQAYQGGKVLGELMKWTAGIGISYLALKGFLMK